MNQQEINQVKGFALELRQLMKDISANADCLILFADVLEPEQVQVVNSRMFDQIVRIRGLVLGFYMDAWKEN